MLMSFPQQSCDTVFLLLLFLEVCVFNDLFLNRSIFMVLAKAHILYARMHLTVSHHYLVGRSTGKTCSKLYLLRTFAVCCSAELGFEFLKQ